MVKLRFYLIIDGDFVLYILLEPPGGVYAFSGYACMIIILEGLLRYVCVYYLVWYGMCIYYLGFGWGFFSF